MGVNNVSQHHCFENSAFKNTADLKKPGKKETPSQMILHRRKKKMLVCHQRKDTGITNDLK